MADKQNDSQQTLHRNTRQRQEVLECVQSRCDHPSADDIYMDVREKDSHISRATVYRNLNMLTESGSIGNVKTSMSDRYDLRLDRHYHMICTVCGKVVDASISYNEEYDLKVEKDTGFKVSRHRILFEGICPECIDNKEK